MHCMIRITVIWTLCIGCFYYDLFQSSSIIFISTIVPLQNGIVFIKKHHLTKEPNKLLIRQCKLLVYIFTTFKKQLWSLRSDSSLFYFHQKSFNVCEDLRDLSLEPSKESCINEKLFYKLEWTIDNSWRFYFGTQISLKQYLGIFG